MKRLIALILFFLIFCGCSENFSVTGNWENGKNKLQFTQQNQFTLSDSSGARFSGIYAIVFDKIQFINSGNGLAKQCTIMGKYSFTMANDSLQLTMEDDPCTERKLLLNKSFWERRH